LNIERTETCPVCGGSSLSCYKPANFPGESLRADDFKITDKDYGKIWALDRCRDCTHVFANPRPSAAFIKTLYGEVVDPLYQDEADGRRRNFERILNFLNARHPGRGRLLDVGAATGILLNLAREQGWTPEGIEPGSWAVETARERYGLDIREGDFETAGFPPRAYTAVTMIDFIEHIPEPFPALSKARKLLGPGGTICLVTPDLGSLAARLAGGRWWHYRPGHLSYFTRGSLQTLLNRAGLKPVKSRRYAWTFSAHYLISRFPALNFLLKNHRLASFWRKIPIKLALGDSFEIFAAE
jgi:SAM-dependent methyltransferase